MPGLTLYSGNRLEVLADKFAESVLLSPLPVMSKEYVVLQSMGMMKWLTVEMSRRLGIWSNYEYIFPNKMVGNILSSFFPDRGDERFFDKDIMSWKCADVILQVKENPQFASLSAYIKDDLTGVKLYQISSRIIDLFDQYMTFRPEMIIDWDKGDMKGDWQAGLWRLLTDGMTGKHPPALLYDVYSLLTGNSDGVPVKLPSQITLFGVSYIPVYHLNILRAASVFSDVNLFILNPSPEYWGNILTEKEKRKIISTSPIIPGDPEDYLHIEQGNTLLASLGRVGRDFLFNIFESDLDVVELFSRPERKSLLTMIQDDIYTMNNGAPGEGKYIFSMDEILHDLSITVNSCHSPMREVEVLHDYILDLLNRDKTLAPCDILVMSPDIEEYSSSIQGIFGRNSGDVPRIPFRIVDRKLKNTSTAVDTFFKIMAISEDRFTSASVLGIAECEEIREKFGLSIDDMSKIGRWVRETSVFWGMDSVFKEEIGLPGVDENTWSFGLGRMLMGGVMGAGDGTPLGIMPYIEIEGSDLQVLGRFISFYNSLRDACYILRKKYTLSGWSSVLYGILDSFFIAAEIPESLVPISEAALKLKKIQAGSLFDHDVSVNVISEYLEKALSDSGSGKDFVSGSLTFCEMLPMRSIPCRVICLLGLNDSAFPRKSRGLSFDLTSADPKRGDRSVRDEDRYLFLETVVSARENLYISYIGQSQGSNSPLNPSVVVNELLEYIDEHYSVDGDSKNVSDYVIQIHRIQPYNPLYFIPGSGFFTYQGARVDGARSYAAGEKSDYRFFDKPLPPLDKDEMHITISGLAEFFTNAPKALLVRRLGLYLGLGTDEFVESESFTFDTLDQYKLNSEIMNSLQKGVGRDDHFNLVRASGLLPHSTPGILTYDRSYQQVKGFYGKFSHLLQNREGAVEIDLDIEGFKLSGMGDNIYDGRNIFFRYASAKSSDILSAWITHLALCATGVFRGDTLLVSKNGFRRWEYMHDSDGILSSLLEIYKDGMIRPLPVFPLSTMKFAETFFDGKKGEPRARALKEAYTAFHGGRFSGDTADPYVAKLFGGPYNLSDDFIDLALKIYTPVYENMKNGEAL